MVRKLLMITALALVAVIRSYGQAKFDNWPEMKAYHTLLSQVYHAAAENGDLKPIKVRSFELLTDIKKVNATEKPAQYDNDRMKSTLKRLQRETDKLNAIIVRQEEAVTVMKQLNVVHDTFHEVEGLCKTEKTNN